MGCVIYSQSLTLLIGIRSLRFARWQALFPRCSEHRTRHKPNNRYVKELVGKPMAHAPRTVPLVYPKYIFRSSILVHISANISSIAATSRSASASEKGIGGLILITL